MIHTTFKRLREAEYASSYGVFYKTLEATLGGAGEYGDDKPIPLDVILNKCGLMFAYALIIDTDTLCEPEAVRVAVYDKYEALAQPIAERYNPVLSIVKTSKEKNEVRVEYLHAREAAFLKAIK